MKTIPLILFSLLSTVAFAQNQDANPFERDGFIFGTAIGGGVIQMTGSGVENGPNGSASFPNFKIGVMLSDRMALLVLLPGTIYKYQGLNHLDRPRDRGFEGIVPSVQYWVEDRWWVMGGAGLTLDSPTFYDVKEPKEGRFHFGPSISISTGYELWRKRRFAIDIQSRVHYGTANIPNGNKREGLAFNFLVGFNLY